MKVCLAQMDIAWNDPRRNRDNAAELMRSAPKSDLYVLPEMFTTGFVVEPHGVAEEDGQTLDWLRAMSKELAAAVTGSVAVGDNGEYHNRMYFVKPDGGVATYDKRHLFAYGGENKRYRCGEERTVAEWRGVRFLLQICYDLRFPKFSRNRLLPSGEAEYDCCIYAANWPSSRCGAWDTLLRARAIENQAYVLGVNRVGEDTVCRYDGCTAIVDAYGCTVQSAVNNERQCVVVATLDMERLRSFRKKFPVLADAD